MNELIYAWLSVLYTRIRIILNKRSFYRYQHYNWIFDKIYRKGLGERLTNVCVCYVALYLCRCMEQVCKFRLIKSLNQINEMVQKCTIDFFDTNHSKDMEFFSTLE